MPPPFASRRLRAPLDHGQSLQRPELGSAADVLATNRQRIQSWDCRASEFSIGELRLSCGLELPQLAREYTRQYRDIADRSWNSEALILAGHQPRLFHPGVWFKNCALDWLGKQHLGTPINLIIDQDLGGTASIPVPVRDETGNARFEFLALDLAMEDIPFECRPLLDRDTFLSFPGRLASRLSWTSEIPMAGEIWQHARRILNSGETNLGRLVASARHAWEEVAGWNTLELPLSRLCETSSFARFAVELMQRAHEFRHVYNQELSHYRDVNHIRSKSHPVPALAQEGDWIEAPFWIFSKSQPRRRRLFVRAVPGGLELTDRAAWTTRWEGRNLAERWSELAGSGNCLRPRALITTLFCRLVASDLFLHGIGGAKYDELTDAIAREFWKLDLPDFLTLTATIRLPGCEHPLLPSELQRVRDQLRDLKFHPENHLPNGTLGVAERLRAAKAIHLRERPLNRDLRNWQRELERLNQGLAAAVSQADQFLRNELQSLSKKFEADRILGSREISFCCFGARLATQLEAALDNPADDRSHSNASK